jgi:hypothetical protein
MTKGEDREGDAAAGLAKWRRLWWFKLPASYVLRQRPSAEWNCFLFSRFSRTYVRGYYLPSLRDWSLQGAASRCCPHRRCGEFAAEVDGVALAVLGTVQDGVDVVEDVHFSQKRREASTLFVRRTSDIGHSPGDSDPCLFPALVTEWTSRSFHPLCDCVIVSGRRATFPNPCFMSSAESCSAWAEALMDSVALRRGWKPRPFKPSCGAGGSCAF